MVGSNSTSTDAPVVYNIIPVPPPPTALTFVNITVPVVTWTVRFPSALLTDASYSIFASNYTTLVGAGAGSSSFVPTSAPGYILSATAGSVIYSSEVDYYPGTSGAAQASALVTSLASPSTFFAANAAFLAYGGTPTMLVAPALTYQSRLVSSLYVSPPPPPSPSSDGGVPASTIIIACTVTVGGLLILLAAAGAGAYLLAKARIRNQDRLFQAGLGGGGASAAAKLDGGPSIRIRSHPTQDRGVAPPAGLASSRATPASYYLAGADGLGARGSRATSARESGPFPVPEEAPASAPTRSLRSLAYQPEVQQAAVV